MEIVGLVIAGGVPLVLGGIILFNQPQSVATRFFFLTTVGIAAWSFGIALFLTGVVAGLSLPVVQLYYIGAALIAVSMLSLAMSLGGRVKHRYWLAASWLVFGIVAAMVAFSPQYIIGAVSPADKHVQLLSLGYGLYGLYFLAMFFATMAVLRYRISRERSSSLRTQLSWLVYAYGPSGLIGSWFNLILPALGNYDLIWIGPLSTFVFVPIAYLAVVRYGLFDLRDAAVRTVSYGLALSVLTVAYYMAALVIMWVLEVMIPTSGLQSGSVHVVLALLVALAFQPIRDFFNYATDWLFYRQEYNRNAFFLELGNLLSHNANLQLLLRRVAVFLQKVFKAEQVFFAVHSEGAFRFFGAKGHGRLPLPDALGIYQACDQRTGQSKVVIADAVEDAALYEMLRVHRIALVLPLVLRERVIGYLLLGEHRGRGYTMRDIQLLESAAGELTVALNNALSLEEVQQLNHSLRQRIDDATRELRESNRQLQRLDEAKNEFISMASHQLRTPLTSIKGYLDMVLEGDLGKINATQKTVLTEAFSSSERMVQLINDFLNVSRLQTGKFSIDRQPSSLEALVREEVTLLQVVARQRQITLKTAISRQLPPLAIDADKFRQVILNMIDNAIYYSPNHSTVSVQLRREGDEAVFTVRDKGIGVPKEEQAGLFGKFFRASNARKRRPDGTGVGLFLARKVVLAHDGQIIFESTEGKGSVFGFRLPLDQRNTPRKTRGARV